MRQISLIINDVRSAHNVGSLFRTAEGFGVNHIYLTGITPHPAKTNDSRLPHFKEKQNKQIEKTALGSIEMSSWSYHESADFVIDLLKSKNYQLIALEQTKNSTLLNKFKPPEKCALLIGNEVNGIEQHLLNKCNETIEIKMYGQKESFNVVQATAVCLYVLREA